MKKIILYSLALSLLANCGSDLASKDDNTKKNENYLDMQADLTDAVKLAISIPEARGGERRLLKGTSKGKFEEIFSGEIKVHSYKLTPTHIIANVEIWEKKATEFCSLIAIPKIQGKTPVLCLNRQLVHCIRDDWERSRYGYDVRGSEVYFSSQDHVSSREYHSSPCRIDAGYNFPSEVRVWDGRSEKVTTLFRSELQTNGGIHLMVRDVFVSQTNGNICIDTDNGGASPLLCKKEGSSEWKRTGKRPEPYLLERPFIKLKNKVLTDFGNVNLETFEITQRNGELPQRIDFSLENGGFLGRKKYGDISEVYKVNPDGNTQSIFEARNLIVTPAQLGNWAWYASSETLRRFSLSDGNLDSKDYFSDTTLVSISNIFWNLGEFLRVEGTGSSGMPATSYLNMQGSFVHVSYPTVVNVEHPIDLKWEN